MKTLLVTLEYPPDQGGIATYLFSLHKNNRDVKVYVPGIDWKFWPKWLPLIKKVWQELKNSGSEQISLSHVLPIGYIALVLKIWKNIPYIIFVHGLDVLRGAKHPWKRFWLKIILRNAKQVVANSEFTRKLAIRYGARENCRVILPCVFSLSNERNNFSESNIILSVGRLVRRKNHKLVLEALSKIKNDFSNLRYVIIGNGPMKDELIDYAEKLGISRMVDFVGKVSDKERENYYKKTGVFVLPVYSEGDDVEGLGIVFLEAAAYGLPVIAGRGGGVEEAVLDGATGYMIDPKNKNELKEKLKIILQDKDLAKQMGQAGQLRIQKEFLCELREEEIEKLYR